MNFIFFLLCVEALSSLSESTDVTDRLDFVNVEVDILKISTHMALNQYVVSNDVL